jgi:glycosyltransferase involved in cell wall biosynthesis
MHGADREPAITCAVVIPALNPSPGLPATVRSLLARGVSRVIVVNDGSDPSCKGLFREIGGLEGCTLLVHDRNLGKGRALKTAFGHFLEHCSSLDGVVTADADDQHSVDDIVALCRTVSSGDGSLVLGMRDFRQKDVPSPNHLGNSLTSRVFQLLYGSYIPDTQTGLRGIPAREIPWMTVMPGDRYEYEMRMLIDAKRRGLPISGVRIRTLYPDGNAKSHYQVLRDSARILACLVSGLAPRLLAAILSGPMDILLFFLFDSFLLPSLRAAERLLASTIIARVVSSIVNLLLNRRSFSSARRPPSLLPVRYGTLWLAQLLLSWSFVYGITSLIPVHDTVVKIFVDFVLGLIGSQVRLRWVFGNRDVTTAAG